MLILLLAFLFSIKGIDVLLSYIGRDFMTALSVKDEEGFITYTIYFLLAFCLAVPLAALYRYIEERFALMWRKWLTDFLFQKYLSNRTYYRLPWFPGIDNPDQRIEEDIRTFTATSLSLFLIFLQSLIALIAFSHVLSNISYTVTAAAFAYAIIGSFCAYYLGRPLIGLNFEQLRKEADYRYKLIAIREHAESVALSKGENSESRGARKRFKAALKNMQRIIGRNLKLNLFTNTYNYIVLVLPTIIVAPLYLRGEIQFGEVTQSAVAFGHVLNALSIIITNFGSISNYAAVVRRLGSFSETLQQIADDQLDGGKPAINVRQETWIGAESLFVQTPNAQRDLIKNLSFKLETGGLLITGPSGNGKSALIRVFASLWRFGSGNIIRPPLDQCAFVPQRPYLVKGSLRNQLLYGQKKLGATDKELQTLLVEVGLQDVIARVGSLGASYDWPATLSTGEQQRIALARALLSHPQYIFLDEATSAIDEAGEKLLYDLLRKKSQSIVSVGSKLRLSGLHNVMLELDENGGWRISLIG